jgi:hypothetical protein
MPAPSMPEARNLHREAQVLIEQAAVQQAESSASHIRQSGSAWYDGGAQGLKLRYMRAARWSGLPTQGARRSGSGSLTRTVMPKTVTLATSSTPDGRATRRCGQR